MKGGNMIEQPQLPTSDERLIAALSHFLGFIIALIVWATQKDKSRFVRFQAIQAMAFDFIVSVITFIFVGCLMVLVFGLLALGVGNIAVLSNQSNPSVEPFRILISLMAALPFLIPCIIIPLVVIIFVARLIATIQTFQGKDFHYPWLGAWVERSLVH
jgi:uncharacterized Tic20 family protein